jgi:hypothetical protein
MQTIQKQAVQFLTSFGLTPNDDSEITEREYIAMIDAAEKEHGKEFSRYLSRIVNATDGMFYLRSSIESWDDLPSICEQR